MKKLLISLVVFALILAGCSNPTNSDNSIPEVITEPELITEEDILELVYEVGKMFRYYTEIDPNAGNIIVGNNEYGGQCGDYALAFVNLWNKRYSREALLVVQGHLYQSDYPDGLYKVIGKDNRDLQFENIVNGRNVSGWYIWNGAMGMCHPENGNYVIELVERLSIISHFRDKELWTRKNPGTGHVWVMIKELGLSVEPTGADCWNWGRKELIIGVDEW